MGRAISLPILMLAAILQATVTAQIPILGGKPDLVFLLVLGWSIHARLEDSVIWAFVGGIVLDLFSAAPIGTSVIGMIITVFIVHSVQRQLYRVGLVSIIWLVLLGTAIQHTLELLILLASGFQPAFANQLGYGAILETITYVILPTMFYNLLLVLPIYWLIRRIQKRVDRDTVSFT
jgi:rod shape-determining protein MreD